MENFTFRSNETTIMESQADDLDTVGSNHSTKAQSLSGGDFAVTNNKTKLHSHGSQTSCRNESKLTDNEDLEDNDSVNKNEQLSDNSNSSSQLKLNLLHYKRELRKYNDTTKHLEKKYLRINTELNKMQIKHEEFLAQRKSNSKKMDDNEDGGSCNSTLAGSSRSSSAYSLKKKNARSFGNEEQQLITTGDNRSKVSGSSKTKKTKHVFSAAYSSEYKAISRRVPSSLNLKQKRLRSDISQDSPLSAAQNNSLKNIYKVLKNMIENQQIQQQKQQNSCKEFINDRNDMSQVDVIQLQNMLSNLQAEQAKSHILIQQQQKCLQEYHNRCMEAQQLVQSQKNEIDHLHQNNVKLESDFTAGIEQLRSKINMKLREVALLPKMISEERDKSEKFSRDNQGLSERLAVMQQEAQQLRLKLEDISKRKAAALSKLRIAERDLKIFRNQNVALKNEKRRLLDELKKVKEQLASATNMNKRALAKQREQFEKQRRDLQKRICEVEMKLSRMQQSSNGIIQERDKVIAELQSQLNTLVHNFEVSQRHIRVLRRHISTMPNGSQILRQGVNNMQFNR